MKKEITTERVPIKLWLDDIEDGALDQAKNVANLPFAFKHIAIMPDSHQGYGMPIGGVLAAEGAIVPNAVGVDIGCGMCAVKTSLTDISQEELKKIMGKIRQTIPVGFKKHDKEQPDELMPDIGKQFYKWDGKDFPIVAKELINAKKSLGTLGGGNHFIEIQQEPKILGTCICGKCDEMVEHGGNIWIMIHSGSRNLGKQVCDHYKQLAYNLNHKWHSHIPFGNKNDFLGFLPIDSEEGRCYLTEMQYCVAFALANRKAMMRRVIEIFEDINNMPLAVDPMINIAHNYAVMENHFGRNVMIHRKGATLASKETIGIIPGSQGTCSYIVEGLGNLDSFNSCSHGAGRAMGRKQAIRDLDLDFEIGRLDDQGIIHGIRNQEDLEEAPSAYKDITKVMANQADLVKIKTVLNPLAVIKG